MPYLVSAADQADWLPPALKELPLHHRKNLYLWEYNADGHWRFFGGSTRFEVWYPWEGQNAQDYFKEAAADHADLWAWLEERFDILELPELRSSGSPLWRMAEGQCSWTMLEMRGRFLIGRTRSRPSSSSTSTEKPRTSGLVA